MNKTLPVIDISDIGDLDGERTRREIDAACRDWGFFQVVGHGIPAAVTRELRRQMREFFALPIEAKHAIERTAENPWGFYDRELTKRTRDWKQVFDYGPADGGLLNPQWPKGLPTLKPAVTRFYEACDALALRLLDTIATNLGMPSRSLDACFRPAHTSFVRLNYYPKCPAPQRPTDMELAENGYLGVNHHTDAGALTLLLQDEQPGLEVFKDGEWILVEPMEEALVVNIGDIVQVWSNDRYRAALHRGLASAENERFSAPFFFNPGYDTQYAPLPSTVDEDHPPCYEPINWGQFRAQRAAGDYADHGEYHHIGRYARKAS
jgi:isopenicillin N synthase-like dioxygenase